MECHYHMDNDNDDYSDISDSSESRARIVSPKLKKIYINDVPTNSKSNRYAKVADSVQSPVYDKNKYVTAAHVESNLTITLKDTYNEKSHTSGLPSKEQIQTIESDEYSDNVEIVAIDGNVSKYKGLQNKMSNTKKLYRIRDDWFKNTKYQNWVVRVENNTSKVSCKYCKIAIYAKKFILDRHASSKSHIAASKPFSDRRQHTLTSLKTKSNNNNGLETYLFLYVACHQSILPTGHLCDVINSKYQITPEIKLRRTKCSNIIQNVLGVHFRADLKRDIGSSPFSLLIDESNDISVIKYLGLAVMYFSRQHRKIVSTYLELCELSKCDAQSIVCAIKDTLNKFNLDIQNLLGLGTDNASVMTGINNGVHAILKKETPSLILIRCACHSIVLAVHHASKCLPLELEFLLRETYNWFAHSSLRMHQYKELYRLINDDANPLNIPRISDTRWLSIEKSIKIILSTWLELSTMFNIEKHQCKTADTLSKMYSNDINKIYFIFLAPILKEVSSVNTAFQSKSADSSKLLNDLVNLLKSLARKIIYNRTCDVITMNITDYIDWSSQLGYAFETEVKKFT